MSKKRLSLPVTHLFRIAAYISVAFWLAFTYAGWKLVSTPEVGKHSHLIGWLILIVATGLMAFTMHYWVKYLQVIFGGLTLGALLATASGHLLGGGQRFPRPIAASILALSIACGLITRTFAGRKITIFDRVALFGLVAAVLGDLFEGSPEGGVIGLAVGFAFLLAARGRNSRARATSG